MSAQAQTKIFGVTLAVDPKILVGALIVVAALLFWYNSRGDTAGAPSTVTHTEAPAVTNATPRPIRRTARRRAPADDRGTLRFRAVDATRGDIDPELRLGLLDRLHAVEPAEKLRNVFETVAVAQAALAPVPDRTIPVKPVVEAPPVVTQAAPPPVTVNVPFKYYGFAKEAATGKPNSGFFLSGDEILVANEGDRLQQRYLVVQLTATSARVEDTQLKMGQTLPVVPEAQDQQQQQQQQQQQ